ncbi:MAG: fibronectin type III domain-containing protein, partial [Clostridiaceae bacterium]|nr:fibronectin type III domain-containing protein [Clostridiaceae bacterium]
FVPSQSVVDDVYYRKVSYDSGITIDVGCTVYVEGMSFDELNRITADKITGFPVEPNDSKEDASLNPDGKRHNVDITIESLEPNTMYVIWVRASRLSVNLTSGPSDPIIITTGPVIVPPVDKPIVPSFNYSLPGDNFIDVGWEINPGYNYYLKYGVEDNVDAAIGDITVTSKELINSVYYRISELQPDTLYYIWVQAEAVNELGQSSRSDWSDSYPVRTLNFLPPGTPKGFGVKNIKDAITKNSITFEWVKESGLLYILEISKDIEYKDSQEYEAGESSEFKVEGLLSNHRYYARLYSFDPVKLIRSEATQSISVKTKRSDDDYDSDQDIEETITGDYIEKGSMLIDGVWLVKITGINADRFVEHVYRDNRLDYKIDLSKPPGVARAARLLISGKVFQALTVLKENLIIDMASVSIVIRPGVIATQEDNPLTQRASSVDYEITITYPRDSKPNFKNMTFKTSDVKLEVSLASSAGLIPIDTFLRPVKVLMPYEDANWYKEGKTFGFIYEPSEGSWDKLRTSAVFDKDRNIGTLSFEALKTGQMAVAEIGNDYFDDIYSHKYETAINKVASVHELKSIKGRTFNPDKPATIGDTVKLMFDVLEYSYGADYMNESAKAGLISFQDSSSSGKNCTIANVSSMLIRVFEIKTGQHLDQKSKSEFISKNGMVIIREDGKLASSKDYATRAEVAALIEKLLVYIGELD